MAGMAVKSGKKRFDDNEILSKYASRIKVDELVPSIKNKLTDKSDRATTEQVLDPRTRTLLLKLINRGDLYEINGCVSTGKEANVYHATAQVPDEAGELQIVHRAIKIYKTSILVFKDRDRYVSGEYRFRNGYSRHNPRKMVKLWAEKEMRNLNRLYAAGIPSPKPLALKLHVLVMEFLGDSDGWPSPRLRDALNAIEAERDAENVGAGDDAATTEDKFAELYLQLVAYMIMMYHRCRLVHADLSEYNILFHEGKLFVIDVSQSVEHDHPYSLQFLRMDIKNVNDFFRKRRVPQEALFSERQLFGLITTAELYAAASVESGEETIRGLIERLAELPRVAPAVDEDQDAVDEAVFRSIYIPQTLEQVYDVERDAEKVASGQGHELVYQNLIVGQDSDESDDDSDDDSDADSDDDEAPAREWVDREKASKNKKFEDRDDKKERKKQVREANREKRAQKMPKHLKKKLVNNSKRG
ncbi:RIO1 family-domain-containing protein [Dipodascopsis tothii]|uniref:RIO1 family-domain-containing protein n=1 Tax=Dipodascopsis tothii TaxID=44089 RepID=UPI0034CD97E3